ncbi:MAG TPA: methyltransferase domain-containing protein [Acidimicrobiales bacterium]|nr:methyltransferase domain-containing protein [Acidimicrobiales bacterium]
MPNVEQVEYWDGSGGKHWVVQQARYDQINGGFGARVVEVLSARRGERVLDVGCGNGALSLAIGPLVAPEGSVLGLDISGPMLAMATTRARAAGLENVRFERGDAQVHALPDAGFDVLVSRFGVMFFDDPHAAFANLARSLRSGGRVVFACWQELLANEWLTVPVGAALAHVPMPELGEPGRPGPFSLADPDRIHSILTAVGFTDVVVDDFQCPMPMGTAVEDTVAFMQGTDMAAMLMADVSEDAAAAAWEAVRAALAPYAGRNGVVLGGAAWIVTATRPL